MADSSPQSSRRSSRTKTDKTGRIAALERLREMKDKGVKHKYEEKAIENVFDIVDEATYSKRVHERQRDDWIIDDGGAGYVEDGREIFDDDIVESDEEQNEKKKKKREKRSKQEKESQNKNFQSIRDLLSTMPAKRKRETKSVQSEDTDDVLGDLLQEIHEDKKAKLTSSTDYLEKSRETERFLNATKIMPVERTYKSPSQPVVKKKFTPFRVVVVKEEPMDFEYVDSFDEQIPCSSNGNGSSTRNGNDSTAPCSKNGNGLNISKTNGSTNGFKAQEKTKAEDFMSRDDKIIETVIKDDPFPDDETFGVETDKDILAIIGDIESFRNDGNSSVENSVEDDVPMCMAANEENDAMNFYWYDMYEEPNNPGVLFIFGKVPSTKANPDVKNKKEVKYVSCTLVVKNMPRAIHFLPKENEETGKRATCQEVYKELNDKVFPKYRISLFRSRPIQKKYCFDIEDVPREMTEYLEVQYNGSLPNLPQDLKGDTFSRVFGTNSPLMENFLLEKKLKGPSWLLIKNQTPVERGAQKTWTQLEFTCEPRDISINSTNMKIPPLTLLSLNIQSVNDRVSKKDSIVFIGMAINYDFHLQSAMSSKSLYHEYFCLVSRPPGEIWPLGVEGIFDGKRRIKMDSERAMLGSFLARLQSIDPDVYVVHDLNFEHLLTQLDVHKVAHWSRIGRLKRSSQIGKNNKMLETKAAVAGRLVCDVKISAKELIRARSYDIQSLATQVLGIKEEIPSYSGPEIRRFFESSTSIEFFANWAMKQNILNIQLVNELQVMPLALQITSIAGNTLSRTLLGGRSERNEFLLLHAFHAKHYILPDKFKPFGKGKVKDEPGEENEKGKKGKSGGPSYAGGLVLAPIKGFYDNFIVLMDFNSLYPSIIQEFNICFTTNTSNIEETVGDNETKGVLPEEIRKLVESRRQVKGLMKENITPDLMRQYDIRQKALKLTANSMYGCLGFKFSRFYAKDLAALVTGKGRDILLRTKDAVEKMGFEVIYGDTDSLMINSKTQDLNVVYTIGNKIKTETNKLYKLLELEIDGIFKFLLLLKKKKYAALVYNKKANGEIETSLELKGLDIVRRDWAPVGATTATAILNEIMTEHSLDDKITQIDTILNNISTKLRAGQVPLNDLLITKQLTKNPEEYKEAAGLYHVKVAKRMNALGILPKKFKNGDTVAYLFCNDKEPHHLRELALSKSKRSKEEEGEAGDRKVDVLKPDPEYYLAQQVHPVVSRICEPIPGLDPSRIAESLGLDPSCYKKRRYTDDAQDNKYMSIEKESEKYKDCEKFKFSCRKCRAEIEIDSLFEKAGAAIKLKLESCPNSNCDVSPLVHFPHVLNSLTLSIRQMQLRYYRNVYVCEVSNCENKSRGVPLRLSHGNPPCSAKHEGVQLMNKDLRDKDLYTQLRSWAYLFDVEKQWKDFDAEDAKEKGKSREELGKLPSWTKMNSLCRLLQDRVQTTIKKSHYSEINLESIFSRFRI